MNRPSHTTDVQPGLGWLVGRSWMLVGLLGIAWFGTFPAVVFLSDHLPEPGDARTVADHALAISLAGLPAQTISGAVLAIAVWLAARPHVPGITRLLVASMVGAAIGQFASPFFAALLRGSLGSLPEEVVRVASLMGFSMSVAVGTLLGQLLVLRWSDAGRMVWFATILLLAGIDGLMGWWFLTGDRAPATVGYLLLLRDVPLTAFVLSAALLIVVRNERNARLPVAESAA